MAKFVSEANVCFAEIAKGAEIKAAEKYTCLGNLRKSISKVKTYYPEEYQESKLAKLSAKIHKARKRLREDFNTNSHWLVRTTQGRHLMPITPNLRATPRVKLSLNDIPGSLNNIAGLKNGLDRIRALQHFQKMVMEQLSLVEESLLAAEDEESESIDFKEHSVSDEISESRLTMGTRLDFIEDSNSEEEEAEECEVREDKSKIDELVKQREYLHNALDQLAKFGDIALTFKEKISLLLEINKWDNDPIQEVELKSLVDRYGKDFVLHFMTKEGMTAELLFDTLKILLLEVHEQNPGIPLIEIVRKWPKTITSLKGAEIENLNLQSLLALADIPQFRDDPIARTVQEYLLNFLDGAGTIRLEDLHRRAQKKHLTPGQFYKEIGQLSFLLHRFGLAYGHLLTCFSDKSIPVSQDPTPFKNALNILSGTVGGRKVGSELEKLANSILYKNFEIFQKTVEGGPLDDSERTQFLKEQLALSTNQLRCFLYQQVLDADTERKKTCLIANFMHLARLMVSLGDFHTAGEIASTLENAKYEADLKNSWNTYKTLKCYKDFEFVDGLLFPAFNHRAFRTHFAEQEQKGLLCIPMISLILGELDKYEQAGSQNRNYAIEELQKTLSEEQIEDICRRLYAGTPSKDKDKKWQVDHIFHDIGKLSHILSQMELPEEAIHLVKKYIKEKRRTDAGLEEINRKVLSLCFAVKARLANKPIKTVSVDFLELVDTQAVYEIGSD